jgi:hypothetical protein
MAPERASPRHFATVPDGRALAARSYAVNVTALRDCRPLYRRDAFGSWERLPLSTRQAAPDGHGALEGSPIMRAIRTIAFSALLFTTTATMTVASGPALAYAQPLQPTIEVVRGDGGGYALPSRPGTESIRGDGGGYSLPSRPATETVRGDGGGYALPSGPATETVRGDGGGYSTPTAPAPQGDSGRWF